MRSGEHMRPRVLSFPEHPSETARYASVDLRIPMTPNLSAACAPRSTVFSPTFHHSLS